MLFFSGEMVYNVYWQAPNTTHKETTMRILFNSREAEFKTPFGTLTPDQICTLHVHVPATVQAEFLTCELLYEDHAPAQSSKLTLEE